jgi:hypothetical protein
MSAINVTLFLGASALALFAFIFLGGCLIYSIGLITEALRATSGPGRLRASRFQRRSSDWTRPTWLKTASVAIGLVLAAAVAITVADDTAALLRAVTAPSVQGAEATAANVANVAEEPLPARRYLSPNRSDTISEPAGTPRECNPNQGIVTDCNYN